MSSPGILKLHAGNPLDAGVVQPKLKCHLGKLLWPRAPLGIPQDHKTLGPADLRDDEVKALHVRLRNPRL